MIDKTDALTGKKGPKKVRKKQKNPKILVQENASESQKKKKFCVCVLASGSYMLGRVLFQFSSFTYLFGARFSLNASVSL